jgi:two-component system, OmpR family, sensor histidine kinase QseC
MKMHWWHSFRGRAVASIVSTCLLVWLGSLAYMFWDAGRERSELFDVELKDTAAVVVKAMPTGLADQSLTANFKLPSGVADGPEFNYQLWTRERRLVSRTETAPTEPMNPSFEPGFRSHNVNGQTWLSYSLNDESNAIQVQVGHHVDQRRSEVKFLAVESLINLGVLLAALCVALTAALLWTARPLKQLRQEVEARAAQDASTLRSEGMPSEVQPLILAFNSLLARAEAARVAQQRFVADAAHELRTPLAALRLQAQVALRAQPGADQQVALERIQQGIDRSTRVAEQLLELARMDSLGPAIPRQAVVLAALGEDLLAASANLAARRGLSLRATLPDARVMSHPALLHTAMRNLLDNALRYSPPGSVVTLGAEQLEGGRWCLSVQDAGPGLSAQERELALQPFLRLHAGDEMGSGLGLAIVQRVALLLGARLQLMPADPAPGLKVTLQLP